MRVSYNWLRDYLDLDLPPKQLADRLTMVGLEVEELKYRFAYLDRALVARVSAVEDHPKSDHLKVCTVETSDGGECFQVVCGAPNVRPEMLSAYVPAGTELPGGTVGEREVRGIKSSGMLCSEAELLVGPDASGIISLQSTCRPGEPLTEALKLDDWIFEIGITPNRPDCLSVLGIAREAAGLMGRRLKYPEINIQEEATPVEEITSVEILAPDHCHRYVARVIRGVKVGPSPFWMVDRLASAGIRSINNVVDITNFVMMETNQPLHAFDLDLLEEGRIVVKTAEEGDRFTTLDNVERILTPDTLMICDGKRAVGIGGVMGGLNSEIHDGTTNVLLESAYFNPVTTRRTSKTLGLSTEASYRFERGADPLGQSMAADRATALIAELAGGQVAAGSIDVHPRPPESVTIDFSPARCNAFLGTDFSPKRMTASLSGIEIKVSGSGEALKVEPPSFRVDLIREVDIHEEVARLCGYYQVPATIPVTSEEPQPLDPSLLLRNDIRDILEGLGLSECVTYSFQPEKYPDILRLPEDDPRRRTVRIINPLSEDQALMRTTMAPGLLEVLRRNQSFNVPDVALYEIGAVFFQREGEELPEERLALGGILSGSRSELNWHQRVEAVDFYDLKGVVEDLLEELRLPDVKYAAGKAPSFFDPTISAAVLCSDAYLGSLGRIHPAVADAYDLRSPAYYFEFDLAVIQQNRLGTPIFSSLPRYPAVERDIALVLDRVVEASRVAEFIQGLGEEHLTNVDIFDVYEGQQVGEGRRSLGFRLRYRSPERTLTDEEVNVMHDNITGRVLAEFDASLRV